MAGMSAGRRADPLRLVKTSDKGRGEAPPEGPVAPPLLEAPDPPSHIQGRARKEWVKRGAEMARVGLLTDLDLETFAAYCHAVQDFQEACILMNAAAKADPVHKGMLVPAKTGHMYMNPLFSVKQSAAKEMTKLAHSLGLTPSGRTSIDRAGKGGAGKPAGGAARKYAF